MHDNKGITVNGDGEGIYSLLPREQMAPSARKLRDIYARTPGVPLYQREFGFMCLERWKAEGMPPDVPLAELFGLDPPGTHNLGQLGWCEAAFDPAFEVRVLEDRGAHELVQDVAGRSVLYFKGKRDGFMPEFVGHPVKDMKSWEENCLWRLDPSSPSRYGGLEKRMAEARAQAGRGLIITQRIIGGYMFLRSLIGPAEVAYMFYDAPNLIHACMRAWFELADTVTARHQQFVTLDELFLAEDICYNHGPLISPDMIREFLLPYYQQLISNVCPRQLDRSRHLYFDVDTDGHAPPVIPLYQSIGLDVMAPFEVAAGCDVVKLGRQFPGLAMFGGIDKRVLGQGKDAIDRHLDYILPAMHRRGGYLPTCDHAVPETVSYENYLHYRKRCREYAG